MVLYVSRLFVKKHEKCPGLIKSFLFTTFLKVMLIFCLVMLVKILKSVVKDRLADFFKDSLNSDLPYVPWLTG